MTSDTGSTRDRLLDAAMSLFASRGYGATSVAEIQRASGLSPGSGALYKHFASKQELLHAVTRREVERMVASRQQLVAVSGTDVNAVLRQVSEAIWEGIKSQADLFRVMFREPNVIENFADEVWSGVTVNAYESFGRALRYFNDSGHGKVADPEATGVVLMAALAYLPVVQLLIERTPGDLDPERFRDAWVRLAAVAFSGAAEC
jgi:AcrR family transcriptional regulator